MGRAPRLAARTARLPPRPCPPAALLGSCLLSPPTLCRPRPLAPRDLGASGAQGQDPGAEPRIQQQWGTGRGQQGGLWDPRLSTALHLEADLQLGVRSVRAQVLWFLFSWILCLALWPSQVPPRLRASPGLRNAKLLLAPARRRRESPWLLSSPSRSKLSSLATRPRASFKEHRGSRVATIPPSCALAARHPRGCFAGWPRDLVFSPVAGRRSPAPSLWRRRWRWAPGAQRSPRAGRAAPGVAGRRGRAPPSPGPGVRAGWCRGHFMGNRWGKSGNSVRLYFSGLQNHCRW